MVRIVSDDELEELRRSKKCVICETSLPYTTVYPRRLLCRSTLCKHVWTRCSREVKEYYSQIRYAYEYGQFLTDGTIIDKVMIYRDDSKVGDMKIHSDVDDLWHAKNECIPIEDGDSEIIAYNFYRLPNREQIDEIFNEARLLMRLKRHIKNLSKVDYSRERMILKGIKPCFPCPYKMQRTSQIVI